MELHSWSGIHPLYAMVVGEIHPLIAKKLWETSQPKGCLKFSWVNTAHP